MTTPGQEPKKSSFKDGFFQYIMNNKVDSITYLILICAIILSIFERFIGGLIVGFILGAYFTNELMSGYLQFKEFISRDGIFRSFVVIAGLVTLFIASPGLVIGTVAGAFAGPYLTSLMSSKK